MLERRRHAVAKAVLQKGSQFANARTVLTTITSSDPNLGSPIRIEVVFLDMQLTRILAASRRLPESYHNMPRRFIERKTTFIEKRWPQLPQYTQKILRYKKEAYYDQWRPWEEEFERLNLPGVKMRKIYVEPIRDWSFFRGDRVEVTRGPEKGKQGIINYIVKERNWVFVEGLNIKREVKKLSETMKQGIIMCSEQPFLVNEEVKLVDPKDFQPCDFEWRFDDAGNKVRVSTRTEQVIPIPKEAYSTKDYVESETYKEQPKDTPAKLVSKVTFVPQVKTFEMDICDEMGIKDDRVPYPMYWY